MKTNLSSIDIRKQKFHSLSIDLLDINSAVLLLQELVAEHCCEDFRSGNNFRINMFLRIPRKLMCCLFKYSIEVLQTMVMAVKSLSLLLSLSFFLLFPLLLLLSFPLLLSSYPYPDHLAASRNL